MANLAIRGHATRGNEVVELLEMLGGKNDHIYGCNVTDYAYIINEHGIIDWYIPFVDSTLAIFTLEEFLEKFPYKVGDKVLYKTYGIYSKIKSMCWNKEKEQVFYRLDSKKLYVASEDKLQPYKEETMEEEGTLVKIDLTRKLCVADEVEVILGDYEFVLKDGKTYFIKKKPQYPKNYEECCKVLMGKTNFQDYSLLLTKLSTKINEANSISPEPPHITLINNFYKLLICRDAYWKMAGEQMGLGEPWEPDYTDDNIKYIIGVHRNHLDFNCTIERNYILIFPTEEMRDDFCENFKELIELCKELL